MLQIAVNLICAFALLIQALIGCCRHDLVAADLLHGAHGAETATSHRHGHSHGPIEHSPTPTPHDDDHDCPCHCQWVNNALGTGPLVLSPAFDGPLQLSPEGEAACCGIRSALRVLSSDLVASHPLPVRAHLAFCRLLI